jgi:hypothetical protein
MENKTCNICDNEKYLTEFYSGRNVCKTCYKNKVKKYVHTKKGKVIIIYKDMKARVLGQTGKTASLYIGLPICKKEEFYDFSLNDPVFNALFDKWKETNWDIDYKPSIDREIPNKGYVLSNIRWVCYRDNIAKDIDPKKYELTESGDLPF